MATTNEAGGMLLTRPSDRAGRDRWSREKAKRARMKASGDWPPKSKASTSKRKRRPASGRPFDREPKGYDPIADTVRQAAEAKGWGSSELAREASKVKGGQTVHREQISYWWNGHRGLASNLLAQVLEALGLTIRA